MVYVVGKVRGPTSGGRRNALRGVWGVKGTILVAGLTVLRLRSWLREPATALRMTFQIKGGGQECPPHALHDSWAGCEQVPGFAVFLPAGVFAGDVGIEAETLGASAGFDGQDVPGVGWDDVRDQDVDLIGSVADLPSRSANHRRKRESAKTRSGEFMGPFMAMAAVRTGSIYSILTGNKQFDGLAIGICLNFRHARREEVFCFS